MVREIFRRPLRRTVPVLMYHHIRPSAASDKLSVSPECFARQMRYLKKHGFRVLTVSELAGEWDGGRGWMPNTAALTFDDGFQNVLDHAVPVLRELGFKATFFLITSKVGTEHFVSWDEARALAAQQFEIGSHSVSHADLVGLDDEALKRELTESRDTIARETGRAPSLFCYPMGRFDERVRRAVRDAGYRAACATNPPADAAPGDPYAIRRIKISPSSDNPWIFRGEVSGYYQWFKEVRRK